MANRMRMTGEVIGNKMAKTVVVLVTRKVMAPTYGKTVIRRTKVYAHTEKPLELGCTVVIQETRALSKLKRWMVVDVVKQTTEVVKQDSEDKKASEAIEPKIHNKKSKK